VNRIGPLPVRLGQSLRAQGVANVRVNLVVPARLGLFAIGPRGGSFWGIPSGGALCERVAMK